MLLENDAFNKNTVYKITLRPKSLEIAAGDPLILYQAPNDLLDFISKLGYAVVTVGSGPTVVSGRVCINYLTQPGCWTSYPKDAVEVTATCYKDGVVVINDPGFAFDYIFEAVKELFYKDQYGEICRGVTRLSSDGILKLLRDAYETAK
jgi:hypothetical protein